MSLIIAILLTFYLYSKQVFWKYCISISTRSLSAPSILKQLLPFYVLWCRENSVKIFLKERTHFVIRTSRLNLFTNLNKSQTWSLVSYYKATQHISNQIYKTTKKKMSFGQIDRQTVIKNTVLSGFTGTGTKKSSPPNIHSM